MTSLRLLLEYGTYPLWLLDDEGLAIDMALPEEWADDADLNQALTDLMLEYDKLFINNETEFKYIGFKTKEEKIAFKKQAQTVAGLVVKKNQGKYPLINDFHLEDL